VDNVKALIEEQLAETGAPSLAVAVAKDGEIVWEEGFGWANREERIEATPHTMYSLASISKPITATGLMVLVERGLVDLDRPVNDYLEDAEIKAWIGSADDATVRRVANHSAGLPVHHHFFHEDESFARPSMAETIRRYGILVTPPGERHEYANLGYGILDQVIAQVSGKSYEDFMREEVFVPLNMPHASVGMAPDLAQHQAVRYGEDDRPIPFYDFDHRGASAVFCSAHDLVRFGMFHLKAHLSDQEPILTDEAIDEMHRPTVEIGKGAGYGIGWRIVEDNHGYRTVSHGGSMGGVRTELTLVPSERIAVAVLVNAASGLPPRVTMEILGALLPEYARKRAHKEPGQAPSKASSTPPAFEPAAELLGVWVGSVHTYNGAIPLTLEFHDDGDIHARLGEQLETLVNEPRFQDGALTGVLLGDIGTEDANRRSYHLHLNLHQRGDLLNGCITSKSLPSPRLGNALSYWAEVKRQGEST